jgi:hypothetical protein
MNPQAALASSFVTVEHSADRVNPRVAAPFTRHVQSNWPFARAVQSISYFLPSEQPSQPI